MPPILYGNHIWEGLASEMESVSAFDGQYFKQLDSGETYIRELGVWVYLNTGLSFIRATKSGKITTDENGQHSVVFAIRFIDVDYTVALTCQDNPIPSYVFNDFGTAEANGTYVWDGANMLNGKPVFSNGVCSLSFNGTNWAITRFDLHHGHPITYHYYSNDNEDPENGRWSKDADGAEPMGEVGDTGTYLLPIAFKANLAPEGFDIITRDSVRGNIFANQIVSWVATRNNE